MWRSYGAAGLELVRISILKSMQYRTNFVLLFLDAAVWLGISVSFFSIIYGHVTSVAGWTLYQMLLLLGFSDLIKNILFAFFIQGLTKIPDLVRTGDLDALLTKPIDSQFLISLTEFNLAQALNTLPAFAVIFYSSIHLNLRIFQLSVILLVPFVIFGVILSYALWFMTMTFSVWMKNSGNLSELFISLQTMSRYPQQVYSGVAGVLFLFVLPVGLVANVPAGVLTAHIDAGFVFYFGFATCAYLLLSIVFWRFAVGRYDSSGS